MRKALIPAACLALASIAVAQKGAGFPRLASEAGQAPESAGTTNFVNGQIISQNSTASGAELVVDISGEESWDLLDDASNTVVVVPLGVGASMTGIGWDVCLTTIGGSWMSEARFYFDGSDHDFFGLFLTPFFDQPNPGSGCTSSGGVLDLTDNGIPDIPILADGNLYIQLHESFNDVGDAVDATWDAPSTLTIQYTPGIQVPAVNQWGMIGLGVALLGGVVWMTLRSMKRPALVRQ